MRIFHIVDRDVWTRALESGEYVPAAFERDGFVHFSFLEQVATVANAIYRHEPHLIVVEVESDAVPSELRVEDCYEAGQKYPHVYGPVPTAAAVGIHVMTRSADGDWVFNRDAAAGPSSTDR